MTYSIRKFWYLFFTLAIFSGCTENIEDTVIIDNRSCSIAIEGMMCEKGCKTTIQNKLSEMDGVIQCEVNFELNKAFITYDGNKLKALDFIEKIEGIADGDLYKAILIEDIDIENAPMDMGKSEETESVSVSNYSIEIPNFIDFFIENIHA